MDRRSIHMTMLTLAIVATAVSAHRTASGVGTAQPEAVAYHGAWQLYRRLAIFFGNRALAAEQAYWKAVHP